MSREAAQLASKCAVDYLGYTVIAVPLSQRKSKERGFNQAGLIAQAVAEEFSLDYQDPVLTRKKNTKAQHKKTREERFENLKNAFACTGDLEGSTVLVVDDICTTGATFLESARALYEAGAQEVRCFSLAKEF